MQFFSRIFGSDAKVSRVRPGDRSPRRRRAQFSLETLEDRDLKSSISTANGVLAITATEPSKAIVSIDQSNNMLKVSLNGNETEIDPGDIWTISFDGSWGGGDNFTNLTSFTDAVAMYGGNNHVVGGSSFNSISFHGDYNSYSSLDGSWSFVYAYDGPNNQIDLSHPTYVQNAAAFVW
jgi:hypothetical protein